MKNKSEYHEKQFLTEAAFPAFPAALFKRTNSSFLEKLQ